MPGRWRRGALFVALTAAFAPSCAGNRLRRRGVQAPAVPGNILPVVGNEAALYQELEALDARNGMVTEGHSNQVPGEMNAMNLLAADPRINTICETGFNGGHSSLRWLLHSKPDAKVYSFDIGVHTYSKPAQTWLSSLFPGRHTITWGDSTQTIPAFKAANPNVKCNLIFVDGGHDYQVATADLINFFGMADPSYNVVMMDDVYCYSPFCQGPNAAWTQLLASGAAVQISANPELAGSRGFAVASYKVPGTAQTTAPPMVPMAPTAPPAAVTMPPR